MKDKNGDRGKGEEEKAKIKKKERNKRDRKNIGSNEGQQNY